MFLRIGRWTSHWQASLCPIYQTNQNHNDHIEPYLLEKISTLYPSTHKNKRVLCFILYGYGNQKEIKFHKSE